MDFESIEAAIAAYEKLETEHNGAIKKIESLDKSKNGLLADLAKLKPIKKFLDDHPDFDPQNYQDLQAKYDELLVESENKTKTAAGEVKSDWEKRLKVIENQLKDAIAERDAEKKKAEDERIRRDEKEIELGILAIFSKPEYEVYSPRQLYALTKGNIKRSEDGDIIYSTSPYNDIPIADAIPLLKNDPEYANQFRHTMSGSGNSQGTGKATPKTNPYASKPPDFAECARLERENPTLAKKLKEEAKAAKTR